MQKPRSEFPEIEEIKSDLDSLKTNVVELTKHMKAEGRVQAFKLGDVAMKSLNDLKKSAEFNYQKAERQVKAQPGKSIAYAFGAGLILSALLRRGK